jgi:predicted AAA+ superfamily ATPase
LELAPRPSPLFGEAPSRGSRKDLLRYLDRGGMPSLFHVRHEGERMRLFEDWIQLTCERDVMQSKKGRIDGDLCRRLLELAATLDEPNAASMATKVRASPRTVAAHLGVLTQIFALMEVKPHPLGSGKPLYFPADCGIAAALGASFRRKLETWLYVEAFSQWSYADPANPPRFSYLRSKTGNRLDLIIEDARHLTAVRLMDSERFDRRELTLLNSFAEKAGTTGKSIALRAVGGLGQELKEGKTLILPWERLA